MFRVINARHRRRVQRRSRRIPHIWSSSAAQRRLDACPAIPVLRLPIWRRPPRSPDSAVVSRDVV